MAKSVGRVVPVLLLLVACGGPSGSADSSADETAPLEVIGTPIETADVAAAPPEVGELAPTADSVFELAEILVAAINTNDVDTMVRYAMTESEFYWIVWPELPANRPEVGMPWDWVWRDTNQKSTNAARLMANRHQGQDMRLLRVEFAGETTAHGAYKVHRDARCVVEMPDGEIRTLDLFGSVLEMNGRFKAYSLLTD